MDRSLLGRGGELSGPAVLSQGHVSVDGSASLFHVVGPFDGTGYDEFELCYYNMSALSSGECHVYLQYQGPDGNWYYDFWGSRGTSDYQGWGAAPPPKVIRRMQPIAPRTLRVVFTNTGPLGLGAFAAFGPNPATCDYFVAGVSHDSVGDYAPVLLAGGSIHATGAGDTKAVPISTAGYDWLQLTVIGDTWPGPPTHLIVSCPQRYPDGSWEQAGELTIGSISPGNPRQHGAISPCSNEYFSFSGSQRAIQWAGAEVYPIDFRYWIHGQPMGLY